MGFSEDVRSAFRRGETEAVVRMSEAEIERARAAGDPAGEVEARYSLARVALRGGDLAAGAARAQAALAVAVRSGDRRLEERPRHVLAAVARMSGDLSRARELYGKSIALNEELGQFRTVATERLNLVFVELGLGNGDTARKLLTSVQNQVSENGWTEYGPFAYLADAVLVSATGDHRRAAYLIGVTDAAFAALGQLPDPDDAVDLDQARAAAIGALGSPAYTEEHARGWLPARPERWGR